MQQLQGQKAALAKQCEAAKAQLQKAEQAQEANMQQTLEVQASQCWLYDASCQQLCLVHNGLCCSPDE